MLLTISDTNQPVASQKRARSWKLWTKQEVGLHYPSREIKGADHLCSDFLLVQLSVYCSCIDQIIDVTRHPTFTLLDYTGNTGVLYIAVDSWHCDI